ncbi:MAG TPA: hypothetical protein VHE57_01690 [Mycobacteriales bacterium]|nr:hypothetical protein [Mycobacteriales bacterium]
MADDPLRRELTLCIVATQEGPLQRTVDALANIEAAKETFEVVLVDATPAKLSGSLDWPSAVQHTVLIAPADATPGALYNLAWQAGGADGVAFVAADAVMDPSWYVQMAQAVRRGRRIAFGRWLPYAPSLHGAGPLSYRLWASPRDGGLVPFDNFAMRRSDLAAVGGFDESEVDHDRVLLDLAARLVESGVDPYHARQAMLFNDVPDWGLADILEDRRRTAAAIEFLAQRPVARSQLLAGGAVRWGPDLHLLLLAAGVVLGLRDRRFLGLTLPWLHHRTCTNPRAIGPRRRWFVLPGVLAMDALETGHAVRARLRNVRGRAT